MKPFEQPHRQRNVDRRVEQDHPQMGVRQAKLRYMRKIGIATAMGGIMRVDRMKNSRSSASGTLKRLKA
jgi:hypothetical protein